MNICTERCIELPECMQWMDDDAFEQMIEQHRIPAIDAYNALLTRSWLIWLKERNLTSNDGDEITYRAWNYGYVWNFLVDDGWSNIVRVIEKRIELEYDVHIVFDKGEAVIVDLEKLVEASQ